MITTKSKVPFQMLFSVSLGLLLCACQTDNVNSTMPEQAAQPTYQMTEQLYLPIITDDMEDSSFSLIYLDDDDIPELVILDGYLSEYSIYTIKDGSTECLVDSMATVEMTYYERKNIISTFFRWNGGGDEGGYSSAYYQMDQYSEILTDDSVPSFQFIYNATYNESGEWSGTGITDYYERGKKIDEAAYDQILADFDIAQSDELSCFSEGGLHFTKEEILTYLNTLK